MPFFFSKPEPQPIVLDDDEMDDLLNSKKPSKYASLMKPINPQCPPCPPCTRGGKQRRKTKSRRTRSKRRGGKKSRRRV